MGMKVLLHIGLPKTGTTSIQYALTESRERIQLSGVWYPKAGISGGTHGHHALAWALYDGDYDFAERLLASMMEESVLCNAAMMVISSERFSFLDNDGVEWLGTRLGDAGIVIYLRNPRDFLESLLSQRIKHSTPRRKKWSGTVQEFLEENLSLCDYFALCSRWASVFGWRSLDIRVYDELKSGGRLLPDFAEVIGLTEGALMSAAVHRANAGPGAQATRAKLMLNRIESSLPGRVGKTKLWDRLRKMIGSSSMMSRILNLIPYQWVEDVRFNAEQSRRIEKYACINKRLAENTSVCGSIKHLYECSATSGLEH